MGLAGRTAVIHGPQPLWLEALEVLLVQAGVRVVARAGGPGEGFDLVRGHEPELLVIDIDGAEESAVFGLIGQVKALEPELRVVVVSSMRDSLLIAGSLRAGANVFCLKVAATDDLTAALRQSFDRSIYLAADPRVENAVAAGASERDQAAATSDLTKREVEILRLVADGHSNSQLARMLWVTEQTIKFHLSNIYRKLDVANRTEASRWAQRQGLLAMEDGASDSARSVAGR
jgi:DNA-binding NarL/FixJ family response regulator